MDQLIAHQKPHPKSIVSLFILLGILVGGFISWYWPNIFNINNKSLAANQIFSMSGHAISDGYADVIEQTFPAVVSIYRIRSEAINNTTIVGDDYYKQFIDQSFTTQRDTPISLGSGVIVSELGYIVTNHHVIANADKIEIDLYDGRTAPAILVGDDPETDLAVLKIDLPNLQAIKIPVSDSTRPGDIAFAIGNPHGLGTSVTMGIISALERNELGLHTFESFIQTDAPINQGNSGGALINTNGHLIGINAALFKHIDDNITSQGVGLAIPAAKAIEIATQLINYGDVQRSWLGVELRLFSKQGTRRRGDEHILINGVFADGPAARAGLQPGDIIVSFDNMDNHNPRAMMDYIAQLPPETSIKIDYLRYGKQHTTNAILKIRPESK